MAFLEMTDYESASPEVRREYDDQTQKNGRVTNMKRILLHNVKAFHAYMEWYTLYDEIVPWLGERALSLFSYAISSGNDCMVCSAFFRKIIADSGDDPDNPALSDEEKLLFDFGRAIANNPNIIEERIYDELSARYNQEQRVLLIAFAGIMAATNMFNNVAKVPLDDVLYSYQKKENNDNG
jgi:alkylhydroperoxidase family enzyme